jgi:predicted component of type VI protein secretion system
MGMGITLMIIFSGIALLPMTELIEIAGIIVSVYLSTGILIYVYLESKLNKAREHALLLTLCQKMIADFQPHFNEVQLLKRLKKMIASQLNRHKRMQMLKNYLENQEDLEKLMLSLTQNQVEAELLANLGLRWGSEASSDKAP